MELAQRIKSGLLLARPEVLLLGTGLVFLAAMLSKIDWAGIIVLITFGAIGLHAGANSIGEYFDFELDKKSRPESQIVKGNVSKRWAITQGVLFYAVSALILGYFFNKLVFGLAVLASVTGTLYSVPPIRLKNHGFVGTMAVTAPFSILFLLSYIGLNGTLNTYFILWFILISVNLFVALLCKDFKDAVAEKERGIKTPPVLMGHQKLGKLNSFLIFVPPILALSFIGLGYLPIYLLVPISLLIILKFNYAGMLRTKPLEKGYSIFHWAIADATLTPYLFAITLHFS